MIKKLIAITILLLAVGGIALGQQNSAVISNTANPVYISLSVSPLTYDWGDVDLASTYRTRDLTEPIPTAENTGLITTKISVMGSDSENWVMDIAGDESFYIGISLGDDGAVALTTSAYTIVDSSFIVGEIGAFQMMFQTPITSSATSAQSWNIFVLAEAL
ncbi:MAG: hypothetical protein ACKKMW_02110 [Candidatus Nealsonbacteria bacterium]